MFMVITITCLHYNSFFLPFSDFVGAVDIYGYVCAYRAQIISRDDQNPDWSYHSCDDY